MSLVCYYHYMGVATINTPGITTLEILEMSNSDKIYSFLKSGTSDDVSAPCNN